MPEYPHLCKLCKHQWNDTYSINSNPPTTCPSCKEEDCVQRLISKPGSVRVELHGRELIEKLWKEGKNLARKARTNENLAADLYGEK